MTTTYELGEKDQRPWGTWQVIALGEGYVVKEIMVEPDQELSLQSHQHREERWTVIGGIARVTLNEDIFDVEAGAPSVLIPKYAKHRVANNHATPLRFIEIQTGDILDEKDIERYEDRYGRAT